MFCTAVSTSLSGVWGQQLLPKCIHAKACQLALPAHSKGQSVSGGAPVGGCKVRLVGGWPGWSFLTREPASQQDQTGCRVNHYPSHSLKKSAPGQHAATFPVSTINKKSSIRQNAKNTTAQTHHVSHCMEAKVNVRPQ